MHFNSVCSKRGVSSIDCFPAAGFVSWSDVKRGLALALSMCICTVVLVLLILNFMLLHLNLEAVQFLLTTGELTF